MGERADRRKPKDLIAEAGLSDAFGDETSATVDCISCGAKAPDGVEIRLEDDRAFCRTCGLETGARNYLGLAIGANKRLSPANETSRALREEHGADSPAALQAQVLPAGTSRASASDVAGHGEPSPLSQQSDASPDMAGPRPRRPSIGETVIIASLALACAVAGLMAAGLSAWANHQAFGAMVDDPFQSQVWAWTGVIASVCSFGGFTFVYWHFANGRAREGIRAILFAVAGALTSIVGTEMFMGNLDAARAANASALAAQRPVLEAQIADWRAQLDSIPGDIRTVEGLTAYIEEVERVGRTHQKPYRDAKVELGQAQRRAALEGNIADARADLLALGTSEAAPQARRDIPSVFFAVMLEVFSSQGTSIGLVALLILFGGQRTRRAG
ncbi:MAG: hypothetical protein AAF253_02505 [Pseudomonadota bacterium]